MNREPALLVLAAGFYTRFGAATETWISPAYQPVVKAAFTLALLTVAVAGVSHQFRRLTGDPSATVAE